MRLIYKPCNFIKRNSSYFNVSSVKYREVMDILQSKYNVDSITDNDKEAIIARIGFVQNHEPQSWEALWWEF